MCTGLEIAAIAAAGATTGIAVKNLTDKTSFAAPAKPAPVVPTKTDTAVETAGANEMALARLRKGRGSTILTGGLSSLGTAGSGKKTLLGQ